MIARRNGKTRPPYVADTLALVTARFDKGWHTKDLAQAAGVSVATVSAAERGRIPKYDVQWRIANALDADPSDFWPLDAAAA